MQFNKVIGLCLSLVLCAAACGKVDTSGLGGDDDAATQPDAVPADAAVQPDAQQVADSQLQPDAGELTASPCSQEHGIYPGCTGVCEDPSTAGQTCVRSSTGRLVLTTCRPIPGRVCVLVVADAGRDSAQLVDSSPRDGGPVADSSVPPVDSSVPPTDTGRGDTGSVDSSRADSGNPDTGTVPPTDTGARDTGTVPPTDTGTCRAGIACIASSARGACQNGTTACSSSGVQTCTPGAPRAETCNVVDDDCNGVVDDRDGNGVVSSVCIVCRPGVACTASSARGACRSGTTACSSSGVETCTASAPRAETCNAIDDDCNGSVDDRDGNGVALSVCSAPRGRTVNFVLTDAQTRLCSGPWFMVIHGPPSWTGTSFAVGADWTPPTTWAEGDYAVNMACGGVPRTDMAAFADQNVTSVGVQTVTVAGVNVTSTTFVRNVSWAPGRIVVHLPAP